MFVRHIAPSLYLIAILCIALIIRLISLDQSFWLDEAAQAVLSRNPFIPGHFNGDFQPPLFYYLAHFWMQWGRAEWFLRLPSVFFAVATAKRSEEHTSELQSQFHLLCRLLLV